MVPDALVEFVKHGARSTASQKLTPVQTDSAARCRRQLAKISSTKLTYLHTCLSHMDMPICM